MVWRRRKTFHPLDVTRPICSFSGGNQHKAISGRWLANGTGIFPFDEPTPGIDVGAKAEIQDLTWRLASEGKGALSSRPNCPK